MHSHFQKHKGPIVKAVRGLASSSNSTCQYPNFKSSVENHTAPCKQSKVSSILGNEYPSLIVLLFNLCRLMQNLSPPSFFLKHHSTGPRAETPSNCPHLNHLLKVLLHLLIEVRWDPSVSFFKRLGSVILMACFMMFHLPKSKPDCENTSAESTSRSLADCCCSPVQVSNPSKCS